MKKRPKNPLKRHSGASLLEYSLVAGLVSVTAIYAVADLGTRVQDVFDTATAAVAGEQDQEGGSDEQIAVDRAEELGFPAGSLLLSFNGTETELFLNLQGASEIYWAPGTAEAATSTGEFRQVYPDSGPHYVAVTGPVEGFKSLSNNLIEVVQWGDVPLTTLFQAFENDRDLASVPSTLPASVTTLEHAFRNGGNPAGLEGWDTDSVTSFAYAFQYNTLFDRDLSGWAVEDATLSGMFHQADAFSAALSGWCVPHYQNTPQYFGALNAASQPAWGYCGAPEPLNDGSALAMSVSGAGAEFNLYIPSNGVARVFWGDDQVSTLSAGSEATMKTVRHNYATDDQYQIHIEGDVYRFTSETDNLISVDSWGDTGLTSLHSAFLSDRNLVSVPNSLPATITTLQHAFENSGNPAGLETWDTSNVTTFAWAFRNNPRFNRNVNEWAVKDADLTGMFHQASGFTGKLDKWCVPHYNSAPQYFGALNAEEPPIWGTCGGIYEDGSDARDGRPLETQVAGALSFVVRPDNNDTRLYVDRRGPVTIYWGDGTTTSLGGGASYVNHSYPNDAYTSDYRIQINGPLNRFTAEHNDTVVMESFGDAGVGLSSLRYTFAADSLLESVPSEIPSTVTDLQGVFATAGSRPPSQIETWTTDQVTNMNQAFKDNGWFTGNLSGWCAVNITSEPSGSNDFGADNASAKPNWGASCTP